MSDQSRILELVEEILDTDRAPEEVCADFPELLAEVRKRLKRVHRVDSQLAAIFPTSDSKSSRGVKEQRLIHIDGDFPQIPGYEVQAVLGHGGMGVVYKAKHLKLNRLVALKMMIYGAAATPLELARFQREAVAVAALRHPQIVQVYDVGEVSGQPFFTMELVEGGNLSKKLAGKPQSANVSASIIAALARAVEAAHKEGIVHRDLKPANILLTSGGEAKISDFGLARRADAESSLTLSGAKLGTPSYMAPEQALGKVGALGPSVDIYALGALLYEMLTGRPPFRAATAAETQRQVISEDPAPPSRLNANVPRDLETICLKCLSKDPSRRYSTAAELTEDLQHFLHGEPITARRPSPLERVGKWVKRRPAVAALVGGSVLFAAVVIVGLTLIGVQQTNRRHGIEADLREIKQLESDARWVDANVVLQQLKARVDAGESPDLRARIEQAGRDLELVNELDRIRLSRLTGGILEFYRARADQWYADAFRKAGVGASGDSPDTVAQRIKASAVRIALIEALDEWAVCATKKERRHWLLTIAKSSDRASGNWGDRIRDLSISDDSAALAELATSVPTKDLSVSLLVSLGERLAAAGDDAANFLKRVQSDHPADFWANMVLGNTLLGEAPVEAGGYYRAALASRPNDAVAYTSLGDSLRLQKKRDEAINYYRKAEVIDGDFARNLTNLGNVLNDSHRTDEAMAYYRKALDADRNYAWAHFDLANALRNMGRMDEAFEHYEKFNRIDPSLPYVANIVRSGRVRNGQGEEELHKWKKSLELNPPQHAAWFGYAELCLFLGHDEEYRLARQDLIQHFGGATDPAVAEPTARAILLAPPSEDELEIATRLAEAAVAAKATTKDKVYPYYLFVDGLAKYRQGHFEDAISIMNSRARTVLGPCPQLVTAMAKYRLGNEEDARSMLADTIPVYDWTMGEVWGHDQWLWHILRREAEAQIFPNIREFFRGHYEPQENDERLVLFGECRFRNLNGAAAQLYEDAFAADPTLVEDTRCCHRYNAACAAALAGAGVGVDAEKLSETKKAAWRKQSRKWLASELESMARRIQSAPTENRGPSIQFLKQWQINPYLAGLRDRNALEKLPADERQECIKLWSDVARLIGGSEEQIATKTR